MIGQMKYSQFLRLLALTGFAFLSFGDGVFDGTDFSGIESIVEAVENPRERWRKKAYERIEEHRKADLRITVLDQLTKEPIEGAAVRVQQKSHAFKFGGVVNQQSMNEGHGSLSAEQYRELFLNFGFNAAGFNNAFKYKYRKWFEEALPSHLEWFKEHSIPVRGHCLIWPGRDNMTEEMTELAEKCEKDPSRKDLRKLQEICEAQIEEWVSKWEVFEWDVMNEPRGNDTIGKLLGTEVYADWFKIARQHAPDRGIGLYLNENRVVSDPDEMVLSKKMLSYMQTVEDLIDEDAPITGLGVQTRFSEMTDAEVIYDRLEKLAEFDLPIAATEFEITTDISEPLDKARMCERVMTVYFSHPSVNGIYAWTIMPSRRVEEEAGREIINDDGLPNLRGKVWLYLMKNRWWTDETFQSSSGGRVSLRAFKGDYEVTVEHAGKTKTVPLTIDGDLLETIRF
jgi:GH35 family endo-1,4-beta-xylanase